MTHDISYKYDMNNKIERMHEQFLKILCIILWQELHTRQIKVTYTTQVVSSVIHSARPTVLPVMNIVFTWNLFCFARFWKVGTDGQIIHAKTIITTGLECGSTEWINMTHDNTHMVIYIDIWKYALISFLAWLQIVCHFP